MGGVRQCIRCQKEHSRALARHLKLQSVIRRVSLTHENEDSTIPISLWDERPREVGCCRRPHLSGLGAAKGRRCIEIDSVIEVTSGLSHVVSTDEGPSSESVFDTNSKERATGIAQLIRVPAQTRHVQKISQVVSSAGATRDVARRAVCTRWNPIKGPKVPREAGLSA